MAHWVKAGAVSRGASVCWESQPMPPGSGSRCVVCVAGADSSVGAGEPSVLAVSMPEGDKEVSRVLATDESDRSFWGALDPN